MKLEVLARSMNAEQLDQRLIQCLAVECMIRPDQLLASMRDGAAANEAALRQVSFFFPTCLMLHVFLTLLTMSESTSNLVYWTHFLGTGTPCSLSVNLPA